MQAAEHACRAGCLTCALKIYGLVFFVCAHRSHSPTRSPANGSSPSRDMSFEELALRPDGTINESYRPIALSIYHQFMPIWLETFQRNQMLIVSGDTLITRPATELAKIESFLNIEPRLGPRNFYFNKTKGKN
jgi:[heparan sulfate]-glucosamine 3-sulfotransferase 5